MATFTVSNLSNSGAGSLRQAISNAKAQGGANTIVFNVGGNLQVSTPLPRLDFGRLTIDGLTAPSSLTLHGGSFSASENSNAVTIIDISSSNNILRGFTIDAFPSSVIMNGIRFKFGASNNLVEDVIILGHGGDEGLTLSNECFDNLIRRVTVRNPQAKRAFLSFYLSRNTFVECVCEDCNGGFRLARDEHAQTQYPIGHTIMRNCRATRAAYGIHADRRATFEIEDCLIEDCRDWGVMVDAGASGTSGGASGSLKRTIIRRSSSGNSARPGLRTRDNGSVLVEDCEIRDCSGNGVQAEGTSVIDLGRGPLNSQGRNILKGNGKVSGRDVQNSTNPRSTLWAVNCSWDHPTVAQVLAQDVSSDVNVNPLYAEPPQNGGGEDSQNIFQANSFQDDAFQVGETTARKAHLSWVQMEIPDVDDQQEGDAIFQANSFQDDAFQVSGDVPGDGGTDRCARVSWVELRIPDPGRSVRVAWVYLQVPLTPGSMQMRRRRG